MPDPFTSSRPAASKENHPGQPAFDPWKILLVSPEPELVTLMADMTDTYLFKGQGFEVDIARDPDEARQRLSGEHLHALILMTLDPTDDVRLQHLMQYVRKDLGNAVSQIVVLVDGLMMPEHQRCIEAHDINNLYLKSEMTRERLTVMLTACLSTFSLKRSFLQQIQENRQIQTELEDSRHRFKEMVLNIGDLIWETDENGQYTYLSENAEALTGFSMEELNRRCFSCLMSCSPEDARSQLFSPFTQKAEPFTHIRVWKHNKAGERICFLSSGRPILNATGCLTGYRGVDRDITQQVLAEKETERLIGNANQAKRLEALGTLAGGIAHDFNNILGVILGYTQLLQMDVGENPKAINYLQQVVDGCNRAKSLTSQILDFSRLKENDEITGNPIHPSPVVKEKLKLLRATIPTSIAIETDIPRRTARVMLSPSQINQVIMHLVTNAYQAMEGGQGTIHVTMADVSLTPENFTPSDRLNLPHGRYVTLEVRDTGRGMPADLAEKVFNPYVSTRKEEGDGKGLGLSMVHTMITRCKGTADLETTPGKGTRITLYLPACDTPVEKKEAAGIGVTQGEGRILFVDDEKMLVKVGKMMLEKLGYQVTATHSPTEALEMVKQSPDDYHLVITDLTMPDIQGNDLAREIKQLRADILVILATGFDGDTVLTEKDQSCFDAVLSKPLSIHALSKTVASLLVNAPAT